MDTTLLIHRISRIQGQLEALKRLLDQQETSCKDVLQLSKTTVRALQSFQLAFSRYQLEHCLQDHDIPQESKRDIITLIHTLTSPT